MCSKHGPYSLGYTREVTLRVAASLRGARAVPCRAVCVRSSRDEKKPKELSVCLSVMRFRKLDGIRGYC